MTAAARRLRACVESWPEAVTGAFDPRCCRFPKSCSATVFGDETPQELLEPAGSAPAAAAGADQDLLDLLGSVDNALRNGSYMNNANLAFELLCERLGVDRDKLLFTPARIGEIAAEVPR